MTDKQVNIIELAKEAGLLADDGEVWLSPYQEAMERFAALVRAEVLAEQAQLQQAKEMLFAVDDVVKQSIDDIKTLSCAGFVLPTMTLKTEASQVKTMTPEEYKTFIEPVKQEPVAFVKENPFCPEGRSDELTIYLPVGTALYAAPVSAKREWVDITKAEQLYLLASHIDKLTGDVMGLSLIDAVIAAFKEKNK